MLVLKILLIIVKWQQWWSNKTAIHLSNFFGSNSSAADSSNFRFDIMPVLLSFSFNVRLDLDAFDALSLFLEYVSFLFEYAIFCPTVILKEKITRKCVNM